MHIEDVQKILQENCVVILPVQEKQQLEKHMSYLIDEELTSESQQVRNTTDTTSIATGWCNCTTTEPEHCHNRGEGQPVQSNILGQDTNIFHYIYNASINLLISFLK